MRVLVGVKRVIDYAVRVRVNAARSGVETKNVKMSMNPFCEIATEEAIKLKEKGIATEVIAVTVGPKEALAQLQTALAMGADRGIHIETDLSTDSQLQPLLVSKALAAMAKKHDAQMIILGKQAIDDDANQTGQMCAGLLNWPQATYASSLAFAPDKKSLTVAREVDGGSQKLSMSLPAVITADLRLNQPRYATLPNIMKAKKKPVENLKLSDLGFDLTPRLRTVSVADPPTRKAGIKVDSVEALVNQLKNTAKVI